MRASARALVRVVKNQFKDVFIAIVKAIVAVAVDLVVVVIVQR